MNSFDYQHLEALAFCATVEAVRKAQGKANPCDLAPGSIQRMLAEVDLITDTLKMLGIDPVDLLRDSETDAHSGGMNRVSGNEGFDHC